MGFKTLHKNGSARIQLFTRAVTDAVLRAGGLYIEEFMQMDFWVSCCFIQEAF